jgi:hypothetical protein
MKKLLAVIATVSLFYLWILAPFIAQLSRLAAQ